MKQRQTLFLLTFAFLISSIAISAQLQKQQDFSKREKRPLLTNAALKDTSLWDCTTQETYEIIQNDQFPFRDAFVSSKSLIDQLLGNRKIDDVYLGNQMLLQDYPTFTNKQQKELANAINAFQGKYPHLHMQMMLVPNAIAIHPQWLPNGAPSNQQLADLKAFTKQLNIDSINLIKPFKESKEALYYRSDHHWTSAAAKLAFDTFAYDNALDTSQNTYKQLPVTNDFYGTLASKTGIYRYPDEIIVYQNENPDDVYRITYSDDNQTAYSMYDLASLESESAYNLFLKGNHPMIRIETASTRRNHLLVIKDSYANAFLPFLTPYYSSITVIDPRYFYDSLETVLTQQQISDVLFLYNMNTFVTDTALKETLNS